MKAMEIRGHVLRRQLPTNRKNMYVYLTPEGRALKEKLVPLAEETNRISTQGVPAADVQLTRKVLLAMIENLARDELQETAGANVKANRAGLAGAGRKKSAAAEKAGGLRPDGAAAL
jgi:DNA-binding MarR family transcriptional regulator